ncbi:MAG TPA: hypothetical protein VF541_02190 [Longimicrobium sp.]
MRCFNHPERDAVGICKACQKGLCPDCIADLGHGVACRGRHEDEVALLQTLVARNAQASAAMPMARLVGPLIYLVLGGMFLAFGLMSIDDAVNPVSLIGAMFIVFGVVIYFVNRKAYGTRRARS